MKNVLYISYDGMTDALGQSQVLPYLAGLSSNGYCIHLISFEKQGVFEGLRGEIDQFCSKSNINWHPQKYTKRPPILSTIWDLRKMWKTAKKLHKEHQFELVHCRSYIPGMVGRRLKLKFGLRFLFDMRGFWVDERVDGGQWNLHKFAYRNVYAYFKKKEKMLFSSCDESVSLTENGKAELLTWKLDRSTPLKVNVIPCCVDLNHFDYKRFSESERQEVIQKYGISSDDLVICYLGSLSTVYLFDNVLKVVEKIESKYHHYKFLIFTHENKDLVMNYIQRSNIINKNNIYIDSLNRNQVPLSLSICDYSIFFCKPTYSRKGTSPTRLAELIACGVKIISNKDVGDSEQHIKENQLGYVFEDFKTEDYSNFLRDFSLTKDFNKATLFETSKKLFSLEEGVSRYTAIYKRLI